MFIKKKIKWGKEILFDTFFEVLKIREVKPYLAYIMILT